MGFNSAFKGLTKAELGVAQNRLCTHNTQHDKSHYHTNIVTALHKTGVPLSAVCLRVNITVEKYTVM